MKKMNYKFLIFCALILLASSFLLTGCKKQEQEVVEEKKEDVVEQEDEKEEVEQESVTTGDFSKFSNKNQQIGNVGDDVYTIFSFSEKAMEGFHRFVFEIEESDNLPNVVASYRAEIGAVRLVFKEIEEDNSGLGYQKSHDINKEGVVRVFHNVSPNEREEVYDIGVAKSTEFLLYSEKIEDENWKIHLDVRYPGEVEVEIDKGSEEFGQEEQEIQGATSSEGARITNYEKTPAFY